MRLTRAFIPTRKEDPADAEMPSHKLLIRAGYMEQVAAGIYNLLPLGWRSVFKIEQIIREEMDRADGQEILMPSVQPAELWQQSGRWEHYGKELLRVQDRKGQDYCLGPTHEEVVTDIIRRNVRSYRDMPLNLYQIQGKFRDELRPRAGLLRGREFIMKDAYSFDTDFETAETSYHAMHAAYERIFTRCGLTFRPVEADTGNIGGSHSHEFQVLAQTGEDRIVSCSKCDYTANEEMAATKRPEAEAAFLGTGLEGTPAPYGERDGAAVEKVETPNQRTIEEVTAFLGRKANALIKTLIYLADEKLVAVLIRGDLEVNEIKLKAALGAHQLFLATEADVRKATGASVGFAGPVGLDLRIVADISVGPMRDAVTGANADDAHVVHVEPGRDFKVARYLDLALAQAGDACPRCGAELSDFRGIEVGHIFLLGTKYSEPMGATYLDTEGKSHPIVMGCYGIGVTRILAAAVEQHHDEHGMILPMALAPYQVNILPMQMKKAEVVEAAEKIYADLKAAGVQVLIDDRNQRPGAKFKDADLIGIPLRITVGARGLKEGKIELKGRDEKDATMVALDQVVETIQARIKAGLGQ